MSGSKDLSSYSGNAIVLTRSEAQVNNELYTTVLTEIDISSNDFWNMYPGYSPKKDLVERIASAMGVEFYNNSKMDERFGDITEYPDGRKVRKMEGYLCTKQGKRRRFDGSWEDSAPKEYEFNWVGRTKLDILADEEKSNDKRKYTFPDNPEKQARRREVCFENNKKFASQRASTGAELNVIKYFAAMPSFTDALIKKGKIVVSIVVKSENLQKLEAAAHIENIRMGGNIAANIDDASTLLLGSSSSSSGNTNKIAPVEKKEENKPDPVKPDEPMTLEQRYESFLELPELKDADFMIDNHSVKIDYISNIVEDNQRVEGVLNWAIEVLMARINK